MKRLILAVSVVLLVAAQASALDAIPGAKVYWSSSVLPSSGQAISKFRLWYAEIDCNAAIVTSATNFDNVTHTNTYTSWTDYYRGRNLEVLDPRSSGGSGNLVMAAYVNDTPPTRGYSNLGGSYPNYEQPADILKINPTTLTHTVLCDGSFPNGGWDTKYPGATLAAPANWIAGKPSNGLSLAFVRGIWYGNVAALYDTNINGVIDNTTAEGQSFVSDGLTVGDAEIGPDGAVYRGYDAYAGALHVMNIKRTGTAGGATTNYLTHTVADGMGGGDVWWGGIAAGPGNAKNARTIIYGFTRDNDANGQQPAIFALQDVNGDNVITPGTDVIQEIWENTQAGIDTGNNSNYDMEDIEIFVDPSTGKRTLFFSTYYDSKLYLLTLADNGLAVSGTGVAVNLGTGFSGSWTNGRSGFELDMNPIAAIPEPATILFIGTGALGGLAYIRRQRMR